MITPIEQRIAAMLSAIDAESDAVASLIEEHASKRSTQLSWWMLSR